MKVNVCGCELVDHLFTGMDFSAGVMQPYFSRKDGDGGIATGKLVFAEDLEKFAGEPYPEIIRKISGGREPDAVNLGGPAIVGAINAAQILSSSGTDFHFYGAAGTDANASVIRSIAAKTPLDMDNYVSIPGLTPLTDVLSDPSCHNGKGERSFLNLIGSAGKYGPAELGDGFFAADAFWFAATALVPRLHDSLTSLLKRAAEKAPENVRIISTVFDFRSEKNDPVGPWVFGEDRMETFRLTDVLIVDREEALRLSGEKDIDAGAEFFTRSGVSSFFITCGAHEFLAWSDGKLFRKTEGILSLPVSALADEDLAAHPERRGDTTGCGDNFAGGVVASLIRQLQNGTGKGALSILDAAAWAAASGGAACFCKGGTFIEKTPGEKYAVLKRYADAYLQDPRVIALEK